MSYIKAIPFCVLLFPVALAASSQETGRNTASLPWTLSVKGASEPVAATQASGIIVFRLARQGANGVPLKIYINNNYHSTLLPEKRTWMARVCPGVNSIDIVPEGKVPSTAQKIYRNFNAGDIAFYQVDTEDNGITQGRFVSEDQAMAIVPELDIQSHTLSRLPASANCPTEVFFLDSTLLFRFGEGDYAGIKEEGRKAVENFSQRLQDKYHSLTKVVVNGYSDPVGNYSYNLDLSRRRAETVARLLIDNGIDPALITKNGFGPEKLLVSDCNRRYRKRDDIISCNQPNRRVSVEIYEAPTIESAK